MFAIVATVYMYMYVCYLCVCGAGVAAAESRVATCVLETEASFMSLGHFPAQRVQEVIVTEGIHAVIVPRETGAAGERGWDLVSRTSNQSINLS